MGDATSVEEGEGHHHLFHDTSSLTLREVYPLLNVSQQRACVRVGVCGCVGVGVGGQRMVRMGRAEFASRLF